MIIGIIKRLVYVLCLLYSVNVIIISNNKYVPINIYTILIVYLFDIVGIIFIIYLKYYC